MNRSLRKDFLEEACDGEGKKKRKRKRKGQEDMKEAMQYSVDDAIYAVDKMYDQFGLVKKMVKSKKVDAAWKKFIAVVNVEVGKMPTEEY